MLVKSIRTQYPIFQASLIIKNTLISLGYQAVPQITAKFLSQALLETGHFKHCWNNNWTNVKRQPIQGDYHQIRCSEIINGQEIFFNPPHYQCNFASYPTPEAGCKAWLSLILDKPRYKKSKELALDPAVSAYDFATQLGKDGFYTANQHLYATAVQNLYNKCLIAAANSQDMITLPDDSSITPDMDIDGIVKILGEI